MYSFFLENGNHKASLVSIIFIYIILFNVFFYTPAIVNWYAETYILDIFIFGYGVIFLTIYLLFNFQKYSLRIYKLNLFLYFIFIYLAFSYSASGFFLNPIYGIKQLIFLFSLILFVYIINKVNILYIFRNFFKFYILMSFILVVSGVALQFMPNSFLPRFSIPNIDVSNDLKLVGSSAILTGTLSVVAFTFFLIIKTKNRNLFLAISILLILLSGTRAAFLEIIIVYLMHGMSLGWFYFRKRLIKLLIIMIVISPLFLFLFYDRLFDPDSNSTRLLLWGMAIAMFLDSPFLGQGVNTFHAIKNNFVDYYLPESYGTHSTIFKFLSEGGLILFLSFVLLWLIFFYFWKKHTIIVKDKGLYIFALLGYFTILFHSIFDNFFLAKVNEYLMILLIAVMVVVLRNKKVKLNEI